MDNSSLSSGRFAIDVLETPERVDGGMGLFTTPPLRDSSERVLRFLQTPKHNFVLSGQPGPKVGSDRTKMVSNRVSVFFQSPEESDNVSDVPLVHWDMIVGEPNSGHHIANFPLIGNAKHGFLESKGQHNGMVPGGDDKIAL
jgi:hypothetical protein